MVSFRSSFQISNPCYLLFLYYCFAFIVKPKNFVTWIRSTTDQLSFFKIYATLGYIVSLILLNLGHVFRFRFRIVSRMCHIRLTMNLGHKTRAPSSRGLVKQYNQELCISSNLRCFTKRPQSNPLNWWSTVSSVDSNFAFYVPNSNYIYISIFTVKIN